MANTVYITENEVCNTETIVNSETHALNFLDLPDPAIHKIFRMADISGMARFVSPKLMSLFRDCLELKSEAREYNTIHISEIQDYGVGLMKWAHENGMFERADELGVPHSKFINTPELVEWYTREVAKDNAYMLLTTPEILEWAVSGGSRRQFMFYPFPRPGPNECDFLMAAKRGNLDVVKWGHRKRLNKPQWSSLCNKAAKGGQLHVLQWARSVTPPYNWGPETTEFAAIKGHLHVLGAPERVPNSSPTPKLGQGLYMLKMTLNRVKKG
jgi:hypothetical protein